MTVTRSRWRSGESRLGSLRLLRGALVVAVLLEDALATVTTGPLPRRLGTGTAGALRAVAVAGALLDVGEAGALPAVGGVEAHHAETIAIAGPSPETTGETGVA